MAQRGELVLLELEEKALEVVESAWLGYQAEPDPIKRAHGKISALIIEVHKMVMQRMNAKYGLDGASQSLTNVREALAKEMELVDQMIVQESRGLQ